MNDLDQIMKERDEAEEMADKLAYAIAPVEIIGEHSNCNNPHVNALEQIDIQKAAISRYRATLQEISEQHIETHEDAIEMAYKATEALEENQ